MYARTLYNYIIPMMMKVEMIPKVKMLSAV